MFNEPSSQVRTLLPQTRRMGLADMLTLTPWHYPLAVRTGSTDSSLLLTHLQSLVHLTQSAGRTTGPQRQEQFMLQLVARCPS